MLTGREIEEHRLQIRLDGCELGDVQVLVRKQPRDDRKIQPLVA
jgi:hypothetical protein